MLKHHKTYKITKLTGVNKCGGDAFGACTCVHTVTSNPPPPFTSSRRPSETLQPKLFGNTWLKLEHPVALQRYASLPHKFRERVQRFTSQPCPAECQHQYHIQSEFSVTCWGTIAVNITTHKHTGLPASNIRLTSLREICLFT